MTFSFKCHGCGLVHEGMPSFGANAPLFYELIPVSERQERCHLESDICVVDRAHFFVRGCLEIPVRNAEEPFSWGVWVSINEKNFDQFIETYDSNRRSHVDPFFGWLSAQLPLYPETENLKTKLHLRDFGIRPYIELEPTDHPLAVEQREGIEIGRVSEIYAYFERIAAR